MAQARSDHTVRGYDQELSGLNALVLRMGGLVQDRLERAMQALRERDVELARGVIARGHVVNFMDVQADERGVALLARRQPMGRDLRTVMSPEKTVTDLERVGDEAERIARMAVHLVEPGRPQPSPKLPRDCHGMARIAATMLEGALDALALKRRLDEPGARPARGA